MNLKSHGGVIMTGKTGELGEKLVPVPIIYHKSHMD
jgi:hypothetical protein